MADLLAKVATRYKDIRTTVFVHLMFTEEIGVDNWHGVRVGACTRCSTRVSTITFSYIYIEKINNNSIFFYSIERKEEEIRKWNRIFRMKESQTMAKVRFIIVGSGQPTFSRRGEKFEPIEPSIGMWWITRQAPDGSERIAFDRWIDEKFIYIVLVKSDVEFEGVRIRN